MKTKHVLSSVRHLAAIVFFLTLSGSISSFYAQTTVTVGTSTGASVNIPLTTYYGYSYTQSIYRGSEITGFGGFPGTISKIRFYYSSGPTQNSDNWTVYLANTGKTAFTGSSDWVPLGQLTQVFSGTVTYPGVAGWMEITLTNPFIYYGGNLVIAVDENAPNYSSSNSNWAITFTPGSTRSIYYRNDNTNPDPATPPSATGTVDAYSDVQLDITAFPLCGGIPAPGNTLSSISAACAGAPVSVNLSLQNTILFSGISFQWQEFDGNNWNNIPGDTLLSTSVSMPSVTTQYRCQVTCSGGGTGTSNPVTITAYPLPNMSVNPALAAVCSGDSITLTASGASTYSWLPATFLNTTSGATVKSGPASSVVYTVTGTSVDGCVASATASVSPVGDWNLATGISPQQICAPGSPVTLDVTNIPSGNGSWEFQWTDTSGQNILQAWSPASQFITTPGQAGEYNYRVSMRNTLCTSDPSATGEATLVVGFGATGIVTHVNCLVPEGSIVLSDAFGQYNKDTLYFDNFSVQPDPQITILSDVAAVTGGRCVVTPSAGSQKGGFAAYNQIPISNADDLEISFLLTADQPINNFGTGGGDGLAYSFGDDAVYSGSANSPANGYGSKLRISFDAADNGTSNNNTRGIYLTYGYTSNNPMGPASPGVWGYSSSMDWKLGTDVPVKVRITNDGKVTLSVNDSIIFSQVQLPPAYVTEDKTGWIHLFSAHTGGDALRQAIDDLLIVRKTVDFGITPSSSGNPPSTWQSGTVFDSLAPGSYTLWMANPADSNCVQSIGTYVVQDLNPQVNLGNDTTICNGTSLVLDAANPGGSFVWSDNSTQQTITVFGTGTYWVQVTDTIGCTDIDAIYINVAYPSSVDGILAANSGLQATFTADNPQNTDTYSWNFGDGNTVNGPLAVVTHTYAAYGSYSVQLIVTSAASCEPDTAVWTYQLTDNTGLEPVENELQILVFPNPADAFIQFSGPDTWNLTDIRITDISGKLVYQAGTWQTGQQIDVSEWAPGIYMVRLQAGHRETWQKILVK